MTLNHLKRQLTSSGFINTGVREQGARRFFNPATKEVKLLKTKKKESDYEIVSFN